MSVLTKGLNFAPTPDRVPVETIITGIEECIARNKICCEDADELRQDVSVALRRAKLPKSNVTKAERKALKILKRKENILVLAADKGNATVVMDVKDYEEKIALLLSDERTYKKLSFDPTSRIIKNVMALINEHKQMLPGPILVPSCPISPKFYGLPKIHKENVPLRPIVSQIDSPTYYLSKSLACILQPLVGQTPSFVRDSVDFVAKLNNIKLEENEIMVSFDVDSLFTNVPIQESVDVIRDLLISNKINMRVADILESVLVSGYFIYNGDFYMQKEGVAMGSPVSPIVADLWMEYFETKALESSPTKPKIWLRYVDDTFCILKKTEVDSFLTHLNSRHPAIKFSKELEEENCLPFLDVKVIRKPDGTLGRTIYRKKTHTDRYFMLLRTTILPI